MQKDNRFFEDMARMASGATGTLFDMKREFEAAIAAKCEQWFHKTGMVSREEFETVREMAQKAREENEALKARLDALEKKKSKQS